MDVRWMIAGLVPLGAGGCAGKAAFTEVDGVQFVGRSFSPTDEDGEVTLECVVGTDGRLSDCKILSERPSGLGFGEAALRGAAQSRLRGAYTGQEKIRYTMRFREDAARRP